MLLNVDKAYCYLQEARHANDGPWIDHSYYVGLAAGKLASHIDGMDEDTAMAYGFVHDIGRIFGEMKIRHIFEGYRLLMKDGYPDAARICLTHSFPVQDIHAVTRIWDCESDDYIFMKQFLDGVEYNQYDKLIQLCDNIGSAEGIVVLERRMVDIVLRYGIDTANLLDRWKRLFAIKEEVETLMGESVEAALGLKSLNDDLFI